MNSHFPDHIAARQCAAEQALSESGFDAMVIHSGTPMGYHADDQDAPFRSTPHFAHWTPLHGPGHLIEVRSGEQVRLIRFAPEDYWHEQKPLGNPFWASQFELEEVGEAEQVWKRRKAQGRVAFIGDAGANAKDQGFAADAINPPDLLARLDWDRAAKTDYELECLAGASEAAVRGHVAARAMFEEGGSELDIHHAYIRAVGCVDSELPYNSIVALNEKGATLHYDCKRHDVRDGQVLLIDSGAICNGYASDITRTWTRDGCDPQFVELVAGLDTLQQELCAEVKPGLPYAELHASAHRKIGALLVRLGILKVSADEAFEAGLTHPFFPHGLGHYLGIQVHDVGGRQKDRTGGTVAPPDQYPFLRTTRTLGTNDVVTIEPGIYFIPMLLRTFRQGDHAAKFDWNLIDRLTPMGGARIEDDVVAAADGPRNLTRAFLN